MMDSQLVAGQWVEVSMEELPTPILLSGFVLSTRASELLLTFPELLSPPKGVEAEVQAMLCYSNDAGRFAAVAHIQRVASGPPVTVTFKLLPSLGFDSRRAPLRMPAKIPVVLRALSSSVASSAGAMDSGAWIEDASASGMLLSTSLLLAVGDVLAVQVSANADPTDVHARVVRVHESDSGLAGRFGVGVLVQPRSEAERRSWLGLVGRLQNRAGR
jgi:hypothetical protein